MKNRLGQCLRDRTLDAMDWVDIRPDPHWANFVIAPAVLGMSLYFIPSGFLPLFIVLCATAAVACFVLVLLAIVGLIAWRTTQDIVSARLATMRKVVSEAKGGLVIQRGRF
ncbi:MAG: hypothetical protein ACO1SV_16145 [Fimbriimonas sp.]